jgi:hypothetical protein
MKEIPLTQGKVALVDDEDYPRLSKFKWCAHKDCNTFYAVRYSRKDEFTDGKRHFIRMHHMLLVPKQGLEIDHINGNGLDNQKINLRLVSRRVNQQNQHVKKSSKFPGVSWHKTSNKWQSLIKIKGVRKHLGFFNTEEEAHIAYKKACKLVEKRK